MYTSSLLRLAPATTMILLCGIAFPANAAQLEIEFDPSNFTAGQAIDNPYWPLIPGTDFVYAAQTDDGCEVNLVSVTTETRSDFPGEYGSIVATVISDLSWLDPECDGSYLLEEQTADWFAQDDSGNVWYFGEATTSWGDSTDCPSTAGSWEAGVDGAQPGIIMLAEPSVGDVYQQELAVDVAEDTAKVLRLNARVSTAADTFENCLVVKEWSPLQRGAIEHKYYCPEGGGLVLIEEHSGRIARVERIGDTLPAGDFAAAGVCGF